MWHAGSNNCRHSTTKRDSPRRWSAGPSLAGSVPTALDTSFNENEPVVCKPQEALDCFLRTKMDLLVMGGLGGGERVSSAVPPPASHCSNRVCISSKP